MKDFQENIVPALRQNSKPVWISENTGLRIMFAGNSITKHAPRPEIGWDRDCGMAASCLEKDYVHQVLAKIREYDPNVAYCIAQVASFERGFFEETADLNYAEAAAFKPDIVIMFYGANVSRDYDTMENPPRTFGDSFEEMRNLLSNDGKAKVYISEGFYIRPVLDAEKKAVAEKYGDTFISMDDIRTREDTHGQFNHPGDLGMELIANRFFEAIEPEVKRLVEGK